MKLKFDFIFLKWHKIENEVKTKIDQKNVASHKILKPKILSLL